MWNLLANSYQHYNYFRVVVSSEKFKYNIYSFLNRIFSRKEKLRVIKWKRGKVLNCLVSDDNMVYHQELSCFTSDHLSSFQTQSCTWSLTVFMTVSLMQQLFQCWFGVCGYFEKSATASQTAAETLPVSRLLPVTAEWCSVMDVKEEAVELHFVGSWFVPHGNTLQQLWLCQRWL